MMISNLRFNFLEADERMNTSMEQILFYTTNKEKAAQVKEVCEGLEVSFRRLTPGDIQQSVAAVVSGDYKLPLGRSTPLPALYAQPELLLFSGLKDKTLDKFLKEYQKSGIAPTDLKAVVTPFNCTWTLYQLTEQLLREHRRLHK